MDIIKENNIDAFYDMKQLNESDIEGIIKEIKNDKINNPKLTQKKINDLNEDIDILRQLLRRMQYFFQYSSVY